jgi:hypothetical protein
MVLGGYTPWHSDQSTMPAFRATLSDAQIAAVTNYVRTAWNNTGTADATGDDVGSLRSTASNVMGLDTGDVQASLNHAGNTLNFDNISGTFSRDGDGLNCQLNANLQSSNPAMSAAAISLAGACANHGSTLDGQITINGTTTPIRYRLAQQTSGSALNAVTIYGQIPGTTDMLHARIAMVTPND